MFFCFFGGEDVVKDSARVRDDGLAAYDWVRYGFRVQGVAI